MFKCVTKIALQKVNLFYLSRVIKVQNIIVLYLAKQC